MRVDILGFSGYNRGSVDGFLLQFDDVLFRDMKGLKLLDFVTLDVLDQVLLSLPSLLELLVLDILLLPCQVSVLFLFHNLLLDFFGVLQ